MSSRRKPSFWQKCNEVFLKLDLFSNPEYLKYRGEGSYQTYTGSIFSVIIVVFFVAFFFNFCQQTINRENITNTPKFKPSLSRPFNTNESNSVFMFAIGLEGIDLNAPKRLFDIFMSSRVSKNGSSFSSEDIPLQPCLLQQWEGINDQFKHTFARLNFKQWVCPPKNYNFTFKGKYTSEEFRYTKLVVRRCNSSSGSCASAEEFTDALLKQQTFKLSIYFANPVIDASEKQYLDYSLEDTNYFEFTDMIGVSAQIFLSEYEVNTENSIYPEPHSDKTTERGLTLNERPVISNFEIINTDEYIRIYLKKADLIQQFDRSYTRFDATFAYLGGLFGMVLMLFYGMKAFSEYAYEFEIGSHLFVYNDDKRSEFENSKFHLLRFPFYLLYCIVTFFYEPAEKWSCFEFYRTVDECRDEVKEQTDVCFLIKRVIYIEKAIQLFCKDKLDQIKINHKWSIAEAKEKREFYDNHKQIRELIVTSEKKAAERQDPSLRAFSAQPADIMINNNELHPAAELTFEAKRHRCERTPREQMVRELDINVSICQQHEMQNPSGVEIAGNHHESHQEEIREESRSPRGQHSSGDSKKELESKEGSNEGLKERVQNQENIQITGFNDPQRPQKRKLSISSKRQNRK